MIKKLLAVAVLLLPLAPITARAQSLSELQVRNLAKQADSAFNIGTAPAIRLYYVGAATQAAIGVTASAMTAEAPLGTADTSFGTAGTFDLTAAAYNTIGELCAAINRLASYKCVMEGAKGDDSSGLLYNVTASADTDAAVVNGYEVQFDTGGVVATDAYIVRLGITPPTGKRVVLKNCSVQNDGTGTVKVYGKKATRASSTDSDATLVSSRATVDDTAKTIPVNAAYTADWIEFAPDAHVVISVGNATTAQTATSYVECAWDVK